MDTIKRYCTLCGKLLTLSIELYDKKFDSITGKPVFHKISVYKCPDWHDGFSDHYYTVHDEFTTQEVVSEIPSNAKFYEYISFTG